MEKLAETCELVAASPKKLEKTAIVSSYFRSVPVEEAAVSAVFLSGRPFPIWEETNLQVGGALLWRTVKELSGKSEQELTEAYRTSGDLGTVAGQFLPSRPANGLRVTEVKAAFRDMAVARGPAAKGAQLRNLLSRATPLEAKIIVKIITGDLRIGLKESLVEEAIAKAFDASLKQVQRANMLLGDIGETVCLASAGKLAEAKMRLFHPLGFMLASPAESAADALRYFKDALVEDKYDGVRAQAHCSGVEVRFFSRTRDEITKSFPELPDALAGLPQDAILDGEIVAWSYSDQNAEATAASSPQRDETDAESRQEAAPAVGRALPFNILQQRLGRKRVSDEMLRRAPIAYLVFDVLYAGGELLIDRPLRERAAILDALLGAPRKLDPLAVPEAAVPEGPGKAAFNSGRAQGKLIFGSEDEVIHEETAAAAAIRAPVFGAASPGELDQLFEAAQIRGNEGLMIKDPESFYTPGRRGKSWLKLKRELATLDVVVTAVEWGHGKRIGVLSDYTFAVRDGDRLVNIGKAYSGLTDVEIAEMTQWFLEHTTEDQGFRRVVEPKIVLEVAFNNMMQSGRHESGYALRFPRIVRLRPDKLPEEADTIQRAKQIYEMQSK